MKRLLARLKNHKIELRIVFDEGAMPAGRLFNPVDTEGATPYAPLATDTPKDMWSYVELDHEQLNNMIEPYVEGNNFATQAIDQAEYATVDTMILVDGRRATFGRISSSMKVGENGKKHIAFKEDGTEYVQSSFIIDFTGEPDAYFDGSSKLYFKSLSKIKPLFKGVEVFVQEATRDEKEAFLSNDIFAVGEINPDFISLKDVQRIAEIRENPKIDLTHPEVQTKIRRYANNYPSSGAGINEEGKLIINSKKDLQAALKLLDQRFYTSEITDEKFESKRSNKMKR